MQLQAVLGGFLSVYLVMSTLVTEKPFTTSNYSLLQLRTRQSGRIGHAFSTDPSCPEQNGTSPSQVETLQAGVLFCLALFRADITCDLVHTGAIRQIN